VAYLFSGDFGDSGKLKKGVIECNVCMVGTGTGKILFKDGVK
jgi:hypothetical protein